MQGYIFSKVTTPFHLDMLSFPIQGELNLSSLQSPQPPNNRTLQSFVEAYLGKYTRRGLIALIVFKYLYIILFLQINYSFFLKDAHNVSSSQPQLQPSNNLTIQKFVEAYVDRYIGGYPVVSHLSELLIVEQIKTFLKL